jgi:hypothetical protein
MFIKNTKAIFVNSGLIIAICICLHIVFFYLPEWEYIIISFRVIQAALIAELIIPIINMYMQHTKPMLYFSLIMIIGLFMVFFVVLLLNTLDILFFNRVMHQDLIETLEQIEIWGIISGRYIWLNKTIIKKKLEDFF